jgi:hypothetical protein
LFWLVMAGIALSDPLGLPLGPTISPPNWASPGAIGATTPNTVAATQGIISGTSTPSPAAGNLYLSGLLGTAPTFGASGEGAIYTSTSGGLSLTGNGGSSDVEIGSSGGTFAMNITHTTHLINIINAGSDTAPVLYLGHVTTAGFYEASNLVGVGAAFINHHYTIATLPSCSSTIEGAIAWIKDTVGAAAPTFHLVVAGSGATTIDSLASCNGTNWVYD